MVLDFMLHLTEMEVELIAFQITESRVSTIKKYSSPVLTDKELWVFIPFGVAQDRLWMITGVKQQTEESRLQY